MRTIKESLLERLKAQKEEAKLQGLTGLAENLEKQIVKNASNVRADDSIYLYTNADIKNDIQEMFWDTLVRVADYYDVNFDGAEMQTLAEYHALNFLESVRVKLGVAHGVGAFEENLPGETSGRVVIELEDEYD